VIDTGVWGQWLIWIAAVLTVWSMVYYLQRHCPKFVPGSEIRSEPL
jgi:CDP-diacylglycerol--glycerol-3-phosphate 3-phosphatidyltransferase